MEIHCNQKSVRHAWCHLERKECFFGISCRIKNDTNQWFDLFAQNQKITENEHEIYPNGVFLELYFPSFEAAMVLVCRCCELRCSHHMLEHFSVKLPSPVAGLISPRLAYHTASGWVLLLSEQIFKLYDIKKEIQTLNKEIFQGRARNVLSVV